MSTRRTTKPTIEAREYLDGVIGLSRERGYKSEVPGDVYRRVLRQTSSVVKKFMALSEKPKAKTSSPKRKGRS